MRNRLAAGVILALGLLVILGLTGPVLAVQAPAGPVLVPRAVEAPDRPARAGAAGDACTAPTPDPSGHLQTYAWLHCYIPAQIAAAYGVDALHAAGNLGAGQTIVLLDAYGSPTARQDLQTFHDAFFPTLPNPNFDAVYPQGTPNFANGCQGNGTGLSGPCAAAGWSGEATLDIEWAYAIAPKAHIVLIGVPPAETEGVQGFPNLFNALQQAIDRYPAGTVVSQSFGVTEQTFGGAAATQTARFDAIYRAAAAKGDTVLASSGDFGSTGVAKQHADSTTYPFPTAGWPASSPWVTAVGGTQLQYGWTWRPTSDVPFLPNGDYNPAYFAFTTGGTSEPVWNETWLPAATGGGASVIYPRPSWQAAQASIIGRDARGEPDLSWNAAVNGGVLVWITAFPGYQRPGWHVYGGTSASSPQVAGLIALANEQQAKAGKAPLGYLNPLLYKVGDQAGAATAAFNGGGSFRDVVPHTYGTAASGVLADNRLWQYNADGSVSPGPVPGVPTLPGWDMTTGFGSPRAATFVAAIRAARNSP
jgi:subtilase family serine protease